MKTSSHKTTKPCQKTVNNSLLNKKLKPLDLLNKHGKFKKMNGDNQNDRLEKVKAKYVQEIQAKERELEALKAKLATVELVTQDAENLVNPESEPDKYRDLGVTDAILDALNCIYPSSVRDKRGATAREISDYMLAHGFQPKTIGQTFSIAVSVALKRLVEANPRRVHKLRVDDRNFYKPAGKVYSPLKK